MTDYSNLKQLALASLECQVPTHQLAHDYAFQLAAKPGLIWQLIEKYEALQRTIASAQSVVEGDLAATYRDQVNGRDTTDELYEDIEKLRAVLGVKS
jgi:hypothetical protein